MDLTKLADLKDLMRRTDRFSDVWRYFLDHFGENPAFIALGERIQHPFLEALFAQIGKQLLGHDADVSQLIITRLVDQEFVHGGGLIDGSLFNVLYFEDVQAGMMAVALSFQPGEMKYVRFSGQRMQSIPKPSVN